MKRALNYFIINFTKGDEKNFMRVPHDNLQKVNPFTTRQKVIFYRMKKFSALLLFFFTLCSIHCFSGDTLDVLLPVRGFCIAAPQPEHLETFVKFIDNELAPLRVNTLVLRVDYNYQYKSHPELTDSIALSKKDVKKLVEVCRENKINLIPQINLLGHQSWRRITNNLLRVYPEFDETPHVKMPERYRWPNDDGLYCKSYCPLHPGVHKVVFDLVDELMDVFEATGFHAGLDEVFYIGDDKCPRCSGRDKAELFAGEVRTIRDHLVQKDRELWIWGDRLLDGKSTGLGMWEASMNNTHRAIDMIPKDVVICDWHYQRAIPTAVYFAMKGFNVVTCPYRIPGVAVKQMNNMIEYRQNSTHEMSDRFLGIMQTVWSDARSFLDLYYGIKKPRNMNRSASECFKTLFKEINELD